MRTPMVVHTPEPARGGMLVVFRYPAFALSAFVVLVAGAVYVMGGLGARMPVSAPVTPPPSIAVSAVPVAPGSGSAVSVFSVPTASAVTMTPGATTSPAAPLPPARRPLERRPASAPLTPAEGVFTRWGTSMFSEEGMLQQERDGKSVFHS